MIPVRERLPARLFRAWYDIHSPSRHAAMGGCWCGRMGTPPRMSRLQRLRRAVSW